MAYKFWNYARRIDADTIGFYKSDGTLIFCAVYNAATIRYIRGGSANGYLLLINGATTNSCSINLAPDSIESTVKVNGDFSIITSGTGRTKFGTYVGTGDVVCNGYIEIKDAGGTARKLMTTA